MVSTPSRLYDLILTRRGQDALMVASNVALFLMPDVARSSAAKFGYCSLTLTVISALLGFIPAQVNLEMLKVCLLL